MGALLALRDIATHAAEHHSAAEILRAAVLAAADACGLDRAALGELRLFAGAPPRLDRRDPTVLQARVGELAHHPPETIGSLCEALLALGSGRKRSGSFYTPRRLAEQVVATALQHICAHAPRVCDPALGGGAFLIETARQIVTLRGLTPRHVAEHCLFGVDIDPLAVAVAEAVLWLWVADPTLSPASFRDRLLVADALDPCWEPRDLDLVIGNPPWVAYAGRAAQPLAPEVRRRYADRFRAFRGYPTLHGLFVERAAQIGPHAVVALVLPSPVADLDGYRPVRAALTRSHSPVEPLLEFGQDAFEGVTQPSFALIAIPRPDAGNGRAWRLCERQRAHGSAAPVEAPAPLGRLAALPTLPRDLFGELGFQSAGRVSKSLFLRANQPDSRHTVPLLEGREVKEFLAGPPRLFLDPDLRVLAESRCRLRPVEQYRRARFVVRQTAKFPIAALHAGCPFRNTLLAGFAVEDLSPELVVALLNSTLYRALHLSRQRDGRQAVFPQVKIAHLRALPRPPESRPAWAKLEALTFRASRTGPDAALRSELDAVVFELFGLTPREGEEIVSWSRGGSNP